MHVVIAGNIGEFMCWYYDSGLDRDQCYYLATYAHLDQGIPMIECKEDLVYVGTYKDNLNWKQMRKEVLLPMVAKWKEYWSSKGTELEMEDASE